MLKLTEEQLDWLTEQIPDHESSPKGGRAPLDKRKAIQGIFWILDFDVSAQSNDNGAKRKDLPPEFGAKSTVHRWFQTWPEAGAFEQIMRDAGRLIEEREGFKLYECFIDCTFSKASAVPPYGQRRRSSQGRFRPP